MNYFARRLEFETDAADVAVAQRDGTADFALLDARSRAAYDAAHLPRALHLRSLDAIPDGPLVVYCWGPGCNAATKACAELAEAGRPVKEMLGGFEYYVREGHPVQGGRFEPDLANLVGLV